MSLFPGKGYAFVTVTSAQTMKELAEFFWRRRLHNRGSGSGRAFKIHPAKHQPSVSTPPPGFPGRVFGYLTNPGHIYWEIWIPQLERIGKMETQRNGGTVAEVSSRLNMMIFCL